MARVKCNTCGGVYDDVLPDGYRYFHSCAPVPAQRVKTAGGAITVVESRQSVTEAKDATGATMIVRTFDPPLPIGATWLEETFVERANKRDENVPATDGAAAGTLKAAGAGVTTITK